MQNYIQSDPQWANHPYAGENMASAGCGPTAVADVVSMVCKATPDEVADYISSIGGASNGYGTYWEAIACAVQHYGMECKQLNSYSVYGDTESAAEEQFKKLLASGEWDCGIVLMGAGFFAKAGHYIVIRKINGLYYVWVYDVAYSPRSVENVHFDAYAPANADGNCVGSTVPYFNGRVKIFYVCRTTDKKVTNKTTPTSYLTTFRPIEEGMHDMAEVFIWQEILKSEGYYTGKLDWWFGPKLAAATKAWQKDHKDWITKKPLIVDEKVGPATWRTGMHMKGTVNADGSISFLLREKKADETGTTCRFAQHVEKARGYYDADIDDSNGPSNQKGNQKYKEKVMKMKDPDETITVDMLKNMCGGR